MGAVSLACTGVRANRMITGMIGAGFNPPPPAPNFPPPSSLVSVPEEADYVFDLVDLAILFEVL